MDTPEGSQTPQDFVYKTKIVVLNYLGFGPPAFDLAPSPETLSGSETESTGSHDVISLDSDEDSNASSKPLSEEDRRESGGSLGDSGLLQVKVRSKSVSPRPSKKFSVKSPSCKSAKNVPVIPKLSSDPGRAQQKRPSLKKRHTFEMHEQYQVALRELLNQVKDTQVHGDELPNLKLPDQDWHTVYQQALRELILSVQKDGTESGDLLCPISREAIVAERIAQIGDRIMETHGKELEQALRNVIESNDGKLSYALFKAVLKETIKTHVPGWYHLAVTLNFTRHLALGLLWSGSRGLESVSDFATRYIEENLADTILDQGGWDAFTCINLDDIDGDSLSGISSGGVSPYNPESVSLGSPSQPSTPLPNVQQPSFTRKGSGHSSSQHVTLRGLQERDLSVKLEKLSKNQKENGRDESDGGKQEEKDGEEEKEDADDDGEKTGDRDTEQKDGEWVAYGKAVVASAAIAGLTAGMYALMKR